MSAPEADNTPRLLLLFWSIVSSLLSVTGNSTVLIASLKYNALKLDTVSVTFIRCIAVADLCYTVVSILPGEP